MERARADRVIDGRDMEPPEPFVHTMAALEAIEPGQTVLLVLRREPFPLYQALERDGFSWRSERTPDGDVEVTMWHKSALPPAVDVEANSTVKR